MAQASEVEEEEVEDAETSNGKKITAFENMPASTPGQHGTPIHSLEARQTERAIPRNQASSGRKKLQLQPPSLVWKKNNARENDDPNRNCHTRKTTQRSSTRPLNAVRNAFTMPEVTSACTNGQAVVFRTTRRSFRLDITQGTRWTPCLS